MCSLPQIDWLVERILWILELCFRLIVGCLWWREAEDKAIQPFTWSGMIQEIFYDGQNQLNLSNVIHLLLMYHCRRSQHLLPLQIFLNSSPTPFLSGATLLGPSSQWRNIRRWAKISKSDVLNFWVRWQPQSTKLDFQTRDLFLLALEDFCWPLVTCFSMS